MIPMRIYYGPDDPETVELGERMEGRTVELIAEYDVEQGGAFPEGPPGFPPLVGEHGESVRLSLVVGTHGAYRVAFGAPERKR